MKNISDQQLRAYFLGKLPEAEAEILEMECAVDARLAEQAQTVESELADDFLRENLSASDAALFEANYLTTEARRAKLRAAAGLWRIAREEKSHSAVAAAAPAASSFWRTLFGRQTALKLAFGAFVLLFVGGAMIYYSSGLTFNNQLVSEVKPVNPPAKSENPAIQNTAPETQAPIIETPENTNVSNREPIRNINAPQKNQPAQKSVTTPKNGGQTQPALAIFALLPGNLRDAGEQFITVAPSTKKLELRLKLPEDAGNYQTYRLEIKTAEGDSIFTTQNLKTPNFTIPSEKFDNRTYIIFLEGKNTENEFESITEYTFRARR